MTGLSDLTPRPIPANRAAPARPALPGADTTAGNVRRARKTA